MIVKQKWTRALIVAAAIAVGATTGACADGGGGPGDVTHIVGTPSAVPGSVVGEPAAEPAVDAPQAEAPSKAEAPVNVDPAAFYGPSASGPGYMFKSPTDNVTCGLAFDNVQIPYGCQARVSVPSNTGVTCLNGGNSVYSSQLVSGAAISQCVNQPFYVGGSGTGENLGGPVLQYGQSITVNGTTCTSEEVGMTCTGGSFGFTLARDRNEIR